VSSCYNITDLRVSFCKSFTEVGFQELIGCSQQFIYLDFSYCPNITNVFFKSLQSQIVSLKELKLRGCQKLSDLVGIYLGIKCRQLQLIDVRGCSLINPEAIIRVLKSVNKVVDILTDINTFQRHIIPVGFPGKVRALELALKDVYKTPTNKITKEKMGSNHSNIPSDNLNVKKFYRAKMKKNIQKQSNSNKIYS
jgi:hypothetical protein